MKKHITFTPKHIVVKGSPKQQFYYFYLYQYSGYNNTRARLYTQYAITDMLKMNVKEYEMYMINHFNAEPMYAGRPLVNYLIFKSESDIEKALEWIVGTYIITKMAKA